MVTLPAVGEGFEWAEQSWGPALQCRPLQAIAPHLFTTRELRLSESPGGWDAVAQAVGVGAGRVRYLNQVHGARVVVVAADDPVASPAPEADALVTRERDVALAVKAADCVPILLADPATGAVGAAHAGWRGTAAGVAKATVDTMQRVFGSRPENLVVAIGPAIGPCCYEVGTELVDAFVASGHARHLIDRWFIAKPPRRGETVWPKLRLDVPGANRDQLILAGVPEEQIHMANLCTAMHLDVLTSFRAEGQAAGRLAGVIRAM